MDYLHDVVALLENRYIEESKEEKVEQLSINETIPDNNTSINERIKTFLKEEYHFLLEGINESTTVYGLVHKLSWSNDNNVYTKCFELESEAKVKVFAKEVIDSISSLKFLDNTSIEIKVKNTEKIVEIEKEYDRVMTIDKINKEEENVQLSAVAQKMVNLENMSTRGIESYASDKKHYLRVPVAKVGSWKSLAYKEVSFTKEDLLEIIKNFNNDELGFEPPIYYGHSHGKDGHPSQGILLHLELHEDVLYGIWEVSKDTYRAVEDGIYRYSSAELAYGLLSKKSGEKLKVTLYGMALTNIPFIPNMPRTQALEDANVEDIVWMSFNNSKTSQEQLETTMPDNKDKNQEPVTVELELLRAQVEEYAVKVKELELTRKELEKASEIQTLKNQIEEYSLKITDYEKTKQQLSETVSQNKELADRLLEYEQTIKEKEIERKVNKVQELCLPAPIKETYLSLIKEGKLGEGEEDVIKSLEDMSKSFSNTMLSQVGSTTETSNLNDLTYEDPYQQEIERCKQILSQRKK